MNRLLLCLMVFFSFSIVSDAGKIKKEDVPKIYAVIVGISTYNDHGCTSLKFAHKDALSYYEFLKSLKGGSVPPDNMVLLTNEMATRDAITGALRNMFNNATEEDVVIFYYAGHGLLDSKIRTDMYFATYDTKDKNYTGTALEREKVVKEFSNCRAKLKLFIIDACHSGGSGINLGTRGDGAESINLLSKQIADIKEPNWAVLTASSRSEESVENERWGGGHGVFTYYFLQGLQGEADKNEKQNAKARGNGDGIVTVREIYDYLNNIIPAETNNNQHPDKQAQNEDAFPLSAVNAEKYVSAVKKYEKQVAVNQVQSNGLLDNPVPNNGGVPETATKDMEPALCQQGQYYYGDICFVNNYKEDILLYGYWKGGKYFPNLLLSKGEKNCLERINISNAHDKLANEDVIFYFRTVDETKVIKYGKLIFNVQACKIKTQVLTVKNLYLSVSGEKIEPPR